MNSTLLEDVLLKKPCERWKTRQAIVLDWHDGPREGFCALSRPECEFYFELYLENRNEDDLDDRLFLMSQIDAGSVDQVIAALAPLGAPSHPVWTPLWEFEKQAARTRAETLVGELKKSKRQTDMIISTSDMSSFADLVRVPTALPASPRPRPSSTKSPAP